jgi:hypothetical protein
MKNKQRNKLQHEKNAISNPALISQRGKKVSLLGVGIVVLGYFILSKVDPAGTNLAAKISPFLILSGYALIGLGILVPEKKDLSSLAAHPQKK